MMNFNKRISNLCGLSEIIWRINLNCTFKKNIISKNKLLQLLLEETEIYYQPSKGELEMHYYIKAANEKSFTILEAEIEFEHV